MPLPSKNIYTEQDYWNMPDGQRAELIHGQLFDMAPPSRIHQKLVMELSAVIRDYIRSHDGICEVYPAPFFVNLTADDCTYVEPDISVICDTKKLSDRGCEGAPDLLVEVVSPGSRRMDYSTKNMLYSEAGVREYWIVDPAKQRSTIYRYEEDAAPIVIPFDQIITSALYQQLQVRVSDLL